MATKKESQQPEVVQQEQHSYVVGLDRGKAKWLTFEYVLSMMSLVLAALLITVALQPLFGEWAGRGSAINYSGSSWLFGLFSLTMATKSTGLVVTAVAAILLAVVALLGFRRVTNGIVDREGMRDVKAGLNPDIPKNYFKNDDPSSDILFRWRSHANLFFHNWLNYYVYQKTPYNIMNVGNE